MSADRLVGELPELTCEAQGGRLEYSWQQRHSTHAEAIGYNSADQRQNACPGHCTRGCSSNDLSVHAGRRVARQDVQDGWNLRLSHRSALSTDQGHKPYSGDEAS